MSASVRHGGPAPAGSMTRSDSLSTMRRSGLTLPKTRDSPRPGAPSMTMRVVSPVSGLAVNRTPETSAGTISCTTTAIATAR